MPNEQIAFQLVCQFPDICRTLDTLETLLLYCIDSVKNSLNLYSTKNGIKYFEIQQYTFASFKNTFEYFFMFLRAQSP